MQGYTRLFSTITIDGRQISEILLAPSETKTLAVSCKIPAAIAAGVQFYISSDIKYHEFFDANGAIVVADIGHYESEQFTINLLQEILEEKFPTFAVLKTALKTNPVHYFL